MKTRLLVRDCFISSLDDSIVNFVNGFDESPDFVPTLDERFKIGIQHANVLYREIDCQNGFERFKTEDFLTGLRAQKVDLIRGYAAIFQLEE